MATKTKSQEKNKMSEIDDQILKYFEIKKRLGKGAYGIVWKAINRKSNQIVAVKKIFDAFRNETDAQRTFREIMFLRAFRNHPNVIQLHSIYKATNNLDIYLSFEYMESDLHNVIKRGTILKDIHKRYVMYQLFNAIKYIHSGNVIHRDLKPSNVLIDSKCRCKIADFGLARSVSQRQLKESNNTVEPLVPILTDYVATRWYRAPEILVASKKYTKGIDMWSLGCILGEMIRGKPIFPGSSTVNQIEKIVSALPNITEKDITAVGAGFGSVLLNQQIKSNSSAKLDELLCGAPEDAKSLVKSLLVLDPSSRLTAKEALSHKYIEKFRHTIPEAELNTDVLPPFRDDIQLTVPEYRSKLYEIIHTTEKINTGTMNINKKKQCISQMKLDNSVTAISKISTPVKIVETERHSSRFKRSNEKATPTLQHNMDFAVNSPKLTSYKNAKASATSHPPSSSLLIDSNLNTMPKVKYCKIPNVAEASKASSASTSERSDNQLNNSIMNISAEKQHSVDCIIETFSDLSGKDQIHKNTSKNNASKIHFDKYNDKNDKAIADSWNKKFIKKYFPPEDHFTSGSRGSGGPDEKAKLFKMSKADILAMTNDNGTYYEKRLKTLEEKIQRHKMDIKAMLAHSTKTKNVLKTEQCSKQKIAQVTATSSEKFTKVQFPLTRSKSEDPSVKSLSQSVKYDYTFPEGDPLNSKKRGSNYNMITAKGLFDIRKSQVTTQ